MEQNSHDHQQRMAWLLGLGLDGRDEHVRITRGEEFTLMGGSQQTHEQMQEQVIRFSEELDRLGKRLRDISPEEFRDIADRTGLGEP